MIDFIYTPKEMAPIFYEMSLDMDGGDYEDTREEDIKRIVKSLENGQKYALENDDDEFREAYATLEKACKDYETRILKRSKGNAFLMKGE